MKMLRRIFWDNPVGYAITLLVATAAGGIGGQMIGRFAFYLMGIH